MKITEEEKNELFEEFKERLFSKNKVLVFKEEGIELPKYAHEMDAGMDIRAKSRIIIAPGETKIIPTGLKVVIPDGYELQVRPRSGLSLKTPLRVANTPGTVDGGYRDEIGVIITNTSVNNKDKQYDINEKDNKKGTYIVHKGDRIAQIVLCKYEMIEFEEVEENVIYQTGVNRGGGFGHSGIK